MSLERESRFVKRAARADLNHIPFEPHPANAVSGGGLSDGHSAGAHVPASALPKDTHAGVVDDW